MFRKFLSGRKHPFSGEQKGLQLFSEKIFAFSPTAAAVANTEFRAAPIIPVVFFPGIFFSKLFIFGTAFAIYVDENESGGPLISRPGIRPGSRDPDSAYLAPLYRSQVPA